MKSIKIKVRTLIVIGLVSILGMVYSEQIYDLAVSGFYQIRDGQDKDYWALNPSSLYGENKRLEIILDKHDYELYNLVALGQGMSSYSSRIRYQDAINVYHAYENFKKEAIKKENFDYMINVALIQWFGGIIENTENILDDMPLGQLDQNSKDHYHLLKAMMALTYQDLQKVEAELNQVSKNYGQTVNTTKAYMANIFNYDIEYEALNTFTVDGDFAPYLEEISIGINEYLLEPSHNDIYGQDLTLKGRVTIDGKPVAGAMVYAKAYKGISSYEGYSKYMTVTDEQGYYTLMSKDKMKGLGIKLPWHIIQDKRIERQWHLDYTKDQSFDFDFESGIGFKTAVIEEGYFVYEIEDQHEGEDYIMQISHTDPSFVNDNSHYRLTEKKGRIALDDLHRVTRFRFGWVGSTDPFNIKMFTEPLYLTGDYYFSVDRVSDNSTYSTNGIFSDQLKTVIAYEGVDYNEGDMLIKEGKIDEAIKWYEDNLNRHNLKVLIALYTYGRKAKSGEYDQILYDKDLDKAIYYSKLLIELDGVTIDRLSSLADLYKGQGNYQEEAKILKQLIKESESVYNHLRLAENQVNLGNYMEGLDIYLTYGDMDTQGDRYYNIFILGDQVNVLPDEIKENLLIKDRSDFKEFFLDIQSGRYEIAYDRLISMKDHPLKTFYHLLFIEAFDFDFIEYPFEVQRIFINHKSGFLDYYVETTKNIGDKDLKSILMFMKERNNWF